MFFIVPIVDSIPYWIDTRVISGFQSRKNLTKETVPVDVDAVLFWKVLDPKKADHAAMRRCHRGAKNSREIYYRTKASRTWTAGFCG